ncbi:unnamed protein product [Ceratitis capitata]|uniref:(Mediterranean fruit fly) hypothetical protein n=1 Tax=Ceratitis capitata TaxID=7213 RepID=A0A811UT26_CERCA|nr:unnamed protein product [Ceratitis capitata]
MREPKDLPEALHLYLKLENQKFRSTHANQQNGFDNYNFRPPLPPRNYPKSPQFYPELAHLAQPQQRFMSYQVAQRPQLHPQRPNIFNRPQYQHGPNQPTGLYQYPQGYHNYNQQQTQRNQHYNPPPRPIAQKPQPKPEPMDIDPSIRINAINYANRPNLKYARKRQPDSNLSNPPMKAQRNFHTTTATSKLSEITTVLSGTCTFSTTSTTIYVLSSSSKTTTTPSRPNIFNRPQYQHGPNHPEPMDIDPSIRINAINYANRPNLKYARKRQPDSNLSNPPMKAQRNFHNGFDNYNFRPPLPPRNYPKSPQFYPELAHLAQPQQRFMSYQVAQRPQLHPQRPNISTDHNTNMDRTNPEPMDIDPSIRINAINYANRPNLKYARKRQPDSNLSNPPMKAQRNFHNGFDNYNFRPPLPPRNYPKSPQFYPELAHLAQPQQRFMSYQVAQRPQLHPQRPNIFNRPQYQHGPNHPEPMDIDPSIRINAINYANRPNLKYARKDNPIQTYQTRL